MVGVPTAAATCSEEESWATNTAQRLIRHASSIRLVWPITTSGCDVVIADTAGRLTTQSHLMEELKKIRRVIGKAQEGAPHEVLLVVDGNTGQNALSQIQAFDTALGLTGVIITKLDGTAKGGVLAALALWSRTRPQTLPVYFIGVGEKLDDLQTFDAREFAQALLG